MENRILPHNEDSEKIVLCSILLDVNAFAEVKPIITSEMFYNSFHAELYENILNLSKEGKAPDIVLLSEKYKGNTNAILKIADISGFLSIDYYDHALNVQEKYIRRLLWKIGNQLSNDVLSHTKETDAILGDLQRSLSDIQQSVSQSSIATFSDTVKEVYKQIENNLKGEYLTGTDTGFYQINKVSGGLQKSDLIIIAGETSQGKTSLALSFIVKAAKTGEGVAVYSMEMKRIQLTTRILSMNTGIPSSEILSSQLDMEHIEILDKGVGRLGNLPIYYDDNSTSNIDKIIASIRTMKQKFDISGAVVDYLQILNVNQKAFNKEQSMGDAARRLKNLAKELDIWIIALSQLNRNETNPVPNLNRLRDSGQIAEAADIVMLVYRPEYYGRSYPEPFTKYSTKGTAMIDIAKGRNIGLLKFICAFDAKTTHFKDFGDEVPEVEEERYF
ncbi:MAG: replicative DNA helicase [Petrimonas sp.]|jgi:replicative DNA helicase